MKYLLLILLSFQVNSTYSQTGEWKQVSSGEVKVWLLSSNVEVSASREERILTKDLDLKSFEEGKIFSSFKEERKNALGVLGLTEWKIEKSNWSPLKEGFKLEVWGSYKNAQKENISFLETHLYQKRKVVQYLNTWPSSFSDGARVSQEFLQKETSTPSIKTE